MDSDVLTEAGECVGKLRSLKVDTLADTYDVEKVKERYRQILTDCARIDC